MNWLPPLVLLEHYSGDWDKYFSALYSFFSDDFITGRPFYKGVRLGLKRHPLVQGKEATFWHMISEGNNEEERTPDFRRCERIKWPKPVIEKAHDIADIKIWANERKNEKRICLWVEKADYLVILAQRKDYILFWTAYLVTQPHQKRKLQKEYEAFIKKANAALK